MPRRTRPTRDEQNALRRAFYEKIERGELTIPEAIKAMREMTGLTQAEFAAHRGVSRRVIQDIERGTGNPTVDSLNSVAKLFGLRVGFVPIRRKEPLSNAPTPPPAQQ
ncbi:MAG TPA: helix-turn-helix domain-containing protein [Trinickia sp.]|uniref:helix-turn-helix domain-containing protein n=1 Tax=Trinickia sp. TaxID=2571163 RepID=UPI002C47EDAD|nr:helix-turn-helix domain-containing protein [Trinickia sp.]HVW53138.1 helix-turn-helix domain-containing protein [Trinickia sp.]